MKIINPIILLPSNFLTGMTTGSLPTFIDISSNFGGAAITDDNLIDIMLNDNKKYVSDGGNVLKCYVTDGVPFMSPCLLIYLFFACSFIGELDIKSNDLIFFNI